MNDHLLYLASTQVSVVNFVFAIFYASVSIYYANYHYTYDQQPAPLPPPQLSVNHIVIVILREGGLYRREAVAHRVGEAVGTEGLRYLLR